MRSALYRGVVTHARLRPLRHRLRYEVTQGLFDLDELPALGRRLRLFGFNRPAAFTFNARDHGDGGGDLRGWVEAHLAGAGLTGPWGAVRVLCLPRMLGYVFNPLSVYFCDDPEGRLAAIVYEVNNTFGERHAYALPVDEPGGLVRQSCDKAFYVSPFMPMELGYRIRVAPPGAAVAVEVAAHDRDGLVLEARFAGEHLPLTDASLARVLIAFPLMTFRVIVGIHWEALKLWLRGARFIPRPGRHAPRSTPAEQELAKSR